MKNINTLYEQLELWNKFGSKEEFLKYIKEQEEEYLSTEVIPFLEDKLKALQRAFKLEISFTPGKDLAFKLSHDENAEASNGDVKPNKQRTRKEKGGRKVITSKKYADIKVTMSDGTIIQEGEPILSYVKTIQTIGIQKLLGFKRSINSRPFLYRDINPKYKEYEQPLVGEGYRINLCFGQERKKKVLEDIFSFLNLDWKVELIEK